MRPTTFAKGLDTTGPRDHALLHLGHVQMLLGATDDAVRTLASTYDGLPTASVRCLRDMFLGLALEQTGAFADANAAYQRAHESFRSTQSPLIAISQLARCANKYEKANAALAEVWGLTRTSDDDDPVAVLCIAHS